MKHDDYKEKPFSTSKIYVIATGIIFLVTLVFVMFLYLSQRIDSTYDTAAIVTMITVTGSIFGSTLVWYSKKAASENHYKLRMALYRDSAATRLEFNEAMMKLKKEYDMTDEDIAEIDSSGEVDEMMDSSLSSVISGLDDACSDADSANEIHTI